MNKGAGGYLIKLVLNIDEFLKTIKEHLAKQEEASRYSEQKFAEFIETRAKEMEWSSGKGSRPKRQGV